MQKRPRPTQEDALAFLRKGHFFVNPKDHHVSWKDREKELLEFRRVADTLLKHRLSKTRNLVLVVLTSHVIAEFLLNKFIEFTAPTQVDVSRERFTFAQKIALLHMFGFPSDPIIIPTLDILNRLRNQVAHSLDLERSQVDLLIKIHHLYPEDKNELNDRDRVRLMKAITRYVCGMIFGAIFSQNLSEFVKRERMRKMPVDDDDYSFLS